METKKIETGQIWSLNDDENGKAFVIDIDNDLNVHFAYIKDNDVIIYHIPIKYSFFLNSITQHIGNNDVLEDFLEAKKVWEEYSGGVWELKVKEILEITLNDN